MNSPLILITNPGSASRKYALYNGDIRLASVHFEIEDNKVVYSVNGDKSQPAGISHVAFSLSKLGEILERHQQTSSLKDIQAVSIRIVAPSPYFQQHRLLGIQARKHLQSLERTAPLHISATMQELELLEKFMPSAKLAGISDSAFHITMLDVAHSYGIPLEDAHQLGIQRYGYHGLSVQSVVRQLQAYHSVPERLIVCHLGSGGSVTAVLHGKSVDTTMGYSPLEGLLMATRSGNIDPTATHTLQAGLQLTANKLQDYLNHRSGLLGVSGLSSDIRELLAYEKQGKERAKLALKMYVYKVQQAIGQMAATLGGIDALVFTGTVGERSSTIRQRVCYNLQFLGVDVDAQRNSKTSPTEFVVPIHHNGSPVSMYVIATDEMGEMAKQTLAILT